MKRVKRDSKETGHRLEMDLKWALKKLKMTAVCLHFRFANTCFCWMTVTMVYYGLSLNATNLSGNPYTNFVLVALVEIPGKGCIELKLGSKTQLKKLGSKARLESSARKLGSIQP